MLADKPRASPCPASNWPDSSTWLLHSPHYPYSTLLSKLRLNTHLLWRQLGPPLALRLVDLVLCHVGLGSGEEGEGEDGRCGDGSSGGGEGVDASGDWKGTSERAESGYWKTRWHGDVVGGGRWACVDVGGGGSLITDDVFGGAHCKANLPFQWVR